MTVSEAYFYLDSVRRIEAEIVKKQLQHDELQSCLLPRAITYDGDHVQTSPDDAMSKIAAKVVDMEREIRDLRAEKARLIVDINTAIAMLESDTEQMILLGFYVGRLPASRIAEIVHYSVRGVYKAKARAVRHLAEKCAQSSVPDRDSMYSEPDGREE